MVKSGMSRIMRNDVADAPVGREGGRSPSALSTGESVARRRDVRVGRWDRASAGV